MKNTSKLIFFAAAMLQALLLPVCASAAADESQEIGVPEAMQNKVKDCFGAYLSPNADRFYTVLEGLLTQYQIKPFKRLGSVALDQERLNPAKDGRCRLLFTNDEKKLIVVSWMLIYAFDTSTGKLLNKSDWEQQRGYQNVIINDDDLLILDNYFIGEQGNGEYVADLTILDINTFKLKQKIHKFGRSF